MFDIKTTDDGLKPAAGKPSHFTLVLSQTHMTPEVTAYVYPGSGTEEDPYLVDWMPGDAKNPYEIATGTKWWMIIILAFGTLSVSLSSSAFPGSLRQIESGFDVGSELWHPQRLVVRSWIRYWADGLGAYGRAVWSADYLRCYVLFNYTFWRCVDS